MSMRTFVGGLVILGLIVLVYLGMTGGLSGTSHATPTPVITASELDSLVVASGTLLPSKRANLAFRIPGLAIEVKVKAGDVVKEGDVLVRLEAGELDAAVAGARASLAVAQASLAELKAGASQEEIAVAQANLDAAKVQLARVKVGPTAEDIAIARANVVRAEANLRGAQSAYDGVKGMANAGMLPESYAMNQATMDLDVARSQYNRVAKGAAVEEIRIAEAGVVTAQAELDRVRAVVRPETVAVGQARVAQAQAAVQQAQAALASTSLTAPFAGAVAAVNINVGETVGAGVPVITLGDLANLRLETDDLSETSVGKVKIGQTVTVAFEALPAREFAGKVTQIAPISSQKQGGTNYTVTVEVAGLDPSLRWGMTGHIEIDTRQ
jgi:multidrug efflux pump subunit AcrA (membrane-fusion protein)